MGLHKFHSEATKKKISESLKNSPNKRGRFQKGHKINLGRKISDETKAKMSKAHKGVKKSNLGFGNIFSLLIKNPAFSGVKQSHSLEITSSRSLSR